MVGAADIVAGDDGDECRGAVGACGLQTAECVGLDGAAGAVAVALCLYACVDARGVAAPELDVGVCYWFAAGCVDDVDVEVRDGAQFAREQVLTDELTSDP